MIVPIVKFQSLGLLFVRGNLGEEWQKLRFQIKSGLQLRPNSSLKLQNRWYHTVVVILVGMSCFLVYK